MHVTPAQVDLSKLLQSLEASRLQSTRVQLLQLGSEAKLTLRTAAPGTNVDAAVQTHVLAELRPDGSLVLPATVSAIPGGNPAAKLTPLTIPHLAATPALAVPRINISALVNVTPPAKPVAATNTPGKLQEVVARDADLSHLMLHATLLSPEVTQQITNLAPPAKNEAQVLRLVSFQGDQMVGGYTIIVTG